MLHLSESGGWVSTQLFANMRQMENCCLALGWCDVYQHGASGLQAVKQGEPTDQVVSNAYP